MGLRAFLYVPAERRILLEDVAELPACGAVLECDGRRFRVTEVHEHGDEGPAVIFLQVLTPRVFDRTCTTLA